MPRPRGDANGKDCAAVKTSLLAALVIAALVGVFYADKWARRGEPVYSDAPKERCVYSGFMMGGTWIPQRICERHEDADE